jgi:prephenate dehydrogenase
VVDVCSVKTKPAQLLQKYLPDHPNMLVTHPLFGPQSASCGDTAGRELIVTGSRGGKAKAVLAYCKDTHGLVIRHTTAEEHDRAMAQVHALTFFLAHGLARARVGEDVPFVTPSFRSLLELIALDKRHTDALFNTIQQGNPYAHEAREALLRNLKDINQEIQEHL